MRIFLVGKNGQVGWVLNRTKLQLRKVITFDQSSTDLSIPGELRLLVRNIRPDVVVNAIAYTAVDKAKSENAVSPCVMAD